MSSGLYSGDKFRGLAIIEALPMFEWHCPRCGEHYLRSKNYFDWSNEDGNHIVFVCVECDNKSLIVIKDDE